jgi:hypothetical protein
VSCHLLAFLSCSGLRYLCKVPPKEPGSECQCKDKCGETCLNRLLHIECVGNAPGGEAGGGGGIKKGGAGEKYHNCNVGPDCGNRAFKNKEYVKYQVSSSASLA